MNVTKAPRDEWTKLRKATKLIHFSSSKGARFSLGFLQKDSCCEGWRTSRVCVCVSSGFRSMNKSTRDHPRLGRRLHAETESVAHDFQLFSLFWRLSVVSLIGHPTFYFHHTPSNLAIRQTTPIRPPVFRCKSNRSVNPKLAVGVPGFTTTKTWALSHMTIIITIKKHLHTAYSFSNLKAPDEYTH